MSENPMHHRREPLAPYRSGSIVLGANHSAHIGDIINLTPEQIATLYAPIGASARKAQRPPMDTGELR